MTNIKLPYSNLYVGEGVVANGIAIVPGSAVVNGRFDGAIEAKEIDIHGNG